MANLPYAYQGSLVGLTGISPLVGAHTATNLGPSGGSYETIEGWRVIVRNRSEDILTFNYACITDSLSPFNASDLQIQPVVLTQDNISYATYFLEPGGWTEFGVPAQAAQGLSSSPGQGLLAAGFLVPVPVAQSVKPQLIEQINIQTDPAPVLSY